MVFENLVVYLLDKYLGDYIENLDTKKLKIDLWSGNVVLENLFLKPNALADLNLPVTLSVGYLEKLTLQVPWKNIYTHPTKAEIDGLFLLVVPKTEVAYDAKREEKEQHETKMKEVKKIEELRKEKEAEKNAKPSDKNNDTFAERMQLQVIRNLELSIRNIHIVYEDRSTKPDHPFALGITLNYITLRTTTPDWQPTILKEDTPLINKLGELSALSVYWNTDAIPRSGLSRAEILKNLRARIAVNNQQAPTDISYILRPLNIKAKIILVMKPRDEQYKRPMFDIKVDLDEISLNISRNQYLDILDLLEFQDYLTMKAKYIKYHSIKEAQGKRSLKNWKFAYEAIVSEQIRPRFECYKWESIKAHSQRVKEYRTLHVQELTGKLTPEQKQRAEDLEKKLDVFNLTYIRRDAEFLAKKKKEQEPKGWFGGVSSWWGGNKPQDPELDLEKVMSPEEKKKLYDAIGYEGDDTSTTSYPEEFVDIDLAVHLNLLDVNIWSKLNPNDTQFRIISRAAIPDTGVVFRRRPATQAIAVFVDLGSFQVFGIATDPTQSEYINTNRPVLAQPVSRSVSTNQAKLLHVEFETNPLDKSSDYRIKLIAQSLEIKYNAPTINKLAECFEQDTQRNLEGVKQAALSTYTDVKHRSYILMKHNIEKIKVLDIDIDLQSSYFLLPQNGVYENNIASICMDLGHLTLKRGTGSNATGTDLISIKEAKDIDEARERSYTQFKLKLENVQLIYANQNESWENARKEKNTRLHLIKPMTLELDLGKCLYTDDAVLPAWRVAGNIPNIDLRLSDKRLFLIMNHIQSIPFPESKHPAIAAAPVEAETVPTQAPLSTTEQTLEAVEKMTPVQKAKEKVEAEENSEGQQKATEEKKKEFEGQLTQLEATFTLDKIDLHIDEAIHENNEDQPFLCLSLESIVAKTKIKTFDMEFDASLADFIVYHQQFVGNDNQQLRLLSAQLDKKNPEENKKLVSLKFLHTSQENPSFSSSPYDGTENQANVHLTKLVINLQLEALLSILRFQDSLTKKLSKDTPEDQAKKIEEQKIAEEKKNNENASKVVKKSDTPASPSLKINAVLEEFRIILATKQFRLFDIQIEGVKADVSQAPEKTLVSLVLSDLRVFDPNKEARYRKILSQQGDDKELLRVDVSLFNHPEEYEKPLEVYDCDVKVQFAKANICLLFKHINALLSFLDSLNITKAALAVASSQADAAIEQVQKLQEQAFKVHLDITFNAPNIIVPTNSFSDEALFLDLGKLTLKTTFIDDAKKFLVEQQRLRLENILASRAKLDREYNILGEAVLLECAELNVSVDRLLYPDKVKNEPGVSMRLEWDLVHFRLAKDDYSCVMRVLMENFSENVLDQIPASLQNEQFHYKQQEQEKEEDELRNAVIKKQKELQKKNVEVVPTLKFRAEIKKLALTLYLGQSDLTVRRGPRNDNLKLANVQIEMLEAIFRQQSDGGYKAVARVKNLLLDDLRETNKPDSVTRMMDRHFTVDPDAQMLIASFEFKPKSESRAKALRKLNAQLESLYFCISLDYLMTLQDFFVSGLPSANAETKPQIEQPATTTELTESEKNRAKLDKRPSTAPPRTPQPQPKPTPPPAPADADVETRVDVIVKHPEIILLEDQHNSNSNCLVLDLALQLRLTIIDNQTEIHGWLKDLTVYSSNFAELKDTNNSGSKVKYRILQPAKADLVMMMNDKEQNIDVRISDIIVSIAPAAIRTVIGVTSSLGTLKNETKDEREKINSKSIFDPKLFKDQKFWFTKEFEERLEQTDVLETVRGAPSQQKPIKEEEQKIKAQEEPPKLLAQKLLLTLETLELKLEVGLGSITKAVVAMCLSNLTADVRNWGSDMTLQSTINVEAALYNEHMLAWEPLIEPTYEYGGKVLSPWCLICQIAPVLPLTEKPVSFSSTEHDMSSNTKQIINIRADQLLNITITKSGLDLVQRLSALFNDVYNKRLPPTDDDDQPLLSLFNATGEEIFIEHLDGLEFIKDPSLKSLTLQKDELVPLKLPTDRQVGGRLSVIEEQNFKKRQEITVKIRDVVKTVSINRTWKRVYELSPSSYPDWPVQMMCDAQVENDRRRIIFSSIVRVFNSTAFPLCVISKKSGERKKVARVDINKAYYIPIDLVYGDSESTIYIGIDENEETDAMFSFDWINEFSSERSLKLSNGQDAQFIVFKELPDVYLENTDEMGNGCFSLHIYPAIHFTNLLPVDIQCSFDKLEPLDIKPSQLQLITSGHKNSSLVFTLPSYRNIKWISDPVNLGAEGSGDHNEHLVTFHNADIPNIQQILRMVLRVDAYHDSYRLSLYSPFWVLNRTNLKLELQIDNSGTFIDVSETPYLVCPENFEIEAGRKGQLRVYGIKQGDTAAWSEKFPLDVIKNTGMASCKVPNDRTYIVCVDIVTSSFGLSKLVTLSPAMVILNKSSIGIEIVETVADKEQDKWETINSEQLIPFWPHNVKESAMRVRYIDSQTISSPFSMNKKHQTLLRMNDEERPAIYVEVTATDFDGVRVIFGDYKIGDAPLLVVNCLMNEPINFCQKAEVQTQLLPPLNYVYYTWTDPLKSRDLLISCGTKSATIQLTPQCGSFGQDGTRTVTFTVFIDGVQTVLLFSDDQKVIESASGMPSLAESMGQHLQVGIKDIGISIVNDKNHEEMLYISLNKSKVVWTETKQSRVKPLAKEMHEKLEDLYRTHVEQREANPENKELLRKKYQLDGSRDVMFSGEIAEIINSKGNRKAAKRQALDGLWIEYSWSLSKTALHVKINRLQIDNQLEYTSFPVMFHPVISKASENEHTEKPFIELSILETKTGRSNIIQFKYFKLLIQEFAVKIDQSFIIAILAFFKAENDNATPTVNMDADLEYINKSLDTILKAQINTPVEETEMFFDNIHLSPLKIHVSFSMHGKPSEELLVEYPLVGFLLRTLNVAEVQDVILRLGYYERNNEKFKTTKITNEVQAHYQNQFMKQLHVLVLGLDVLGNPFGVIRGLAEGVESFFYEPYKGAIEGPMEFAEGVATGVKSLFGSAVGGAAGAFSKITGVLGKGLATLTFDEDYKASRIRRREPAGNAAAEIATGGKNVMMGFVDGITGVVKKPIQGAKKDGASGFFKGLGKGFIGLVTRPTGGIVDFTSNSFDLIKRTAQNEEIIRRVRYPRHLGGDGLVRPYISHDAMGFYILNRLEEGQYAKSDTYVGHISCLESPPSWLMATSKRLLFVTEISFLGLYEIDWQIPYEELKEVPIIKANTSQIQILTKNKIGSSLLTKTINKTISSSVVEDIDYDVKKVGTMKSNRTYGKLVKYRAPSDAKYIIDKIAGAMHLASI